MCTPDYAPRPSTGPRTPSSKLCSVTRLHCRRNRFADSIGATPMQCWPLKQAHTTPEKRLSLCSCFAASLELRLPKSQSHSHDTRLASMSRAPGSAPQARTKCLVGRPARARARAPVISIAASLRCWMAQRRSGFSFTVKLVSGLGLGLGRRTRHLDCGLIEVLDGPARLRVHVHVRFKSGLVRARQLDCSLVVVLDGPARLFRVYVHGRFIIGLGAYPSPRSRPR